MTYDFMLSPSHNPHPTAQQTFQNRFSTIHPLSCRESCLVLLAAPFFKSWVLLLLGQLVRHTPVVVYSSFLASLCAIRCFFLLRQRTDGQWPPPPPPVLLFFVSFSSRLWVVSGSLHHLPPVLWKLLAISHYDDKKKRKTGDDGPEVGRRTGAPKNSFFFFSFVGVFVFIHSSRFSTLVVINQTSIYNICDFMAVGSKQGSFFLSV